MSWDWVPPREGEDPREGPSPRLRMIVTVLMVLFAGTLAVFYLTQYVSTTEEQCVRDRPSGVPTAQVESGWRWWPPDITCTYPTGTTGTALDESGR